MKNTINILLVLLIFFSFSCKNDNNILTIGIKSKEYTISKKDSSSYKINLEKDKFYSFTVMQKGIDVAVTLKNNQQEVLEEKDSPNGINGPEQFYFYCTKSDSYTLKISPFNEKDNSKQGNYNIEILELSKETDATLTKEKYLKDFELFKEIYEKANAGLYKYHTQQEIDSVFLSNKKAINNTTTFREFYTLVWNVIDYTGSCHNSLDYPENLNILLHKEKIYFPFPLKYIEGKLYSNLSYKEIPLGVEIVSINGVNATDFLGKIAHYISTDGINKTGKYAYVETGTLAKIIYYAFGKQNDFTIQFSKNNTITTTKINSVTYNQFYENYTNRFSKEENDTPKYSFKYLKDSNSGLLTVSSFLIGPPGTQEHLNYTSFLDSTFTNLKKNNVKSLIIDIRNNGGGYDPNDLLLFSYLTKRSFKENTKAYTLFQKVPLAKYYTIGDEDLLSEELKEEHSIFKNGKYYQNSKYNKTWQPKENAFNGQIYVLINPFVASAGSLFASMVKSDTETIVIGEETLGGYYGHTGHIPVSYKLPNSNLLLTFFIVDVEQDVKKISDENFGDGVKPNFKVIQSHTDFMNKTDTQLTFALKKMNSKN